MEKLALEGAWIELNRARDQIEALATLTPTDIEQIQKIKDHWAAFLMHAGRVFNKLAAGSKSTPKSVAWLGRVKHQRKTDPFLIYIHHARNADEHGLAFIAQEQPGVIRAVDPTPEEREAYERAKASNPNLGIHVTVEITEPHVRLLDVVDSGVTYSPPPGCIKPYNTGMLALSRLEPILHDAEQYVT